MNNVNHTFAAADERTVLLPARAVVTASLGMAGPAATGDPILSCLLPCWRRLRRALWAGDAN